LSRYGDNKRKADQWVRIAAVTGFLSDLYAVRQPGEPRVFPWNYGATSLYNVLWEIQAAAGIHLPCREDHEHTESCHRYGFHSFRYAHATYNFGRVPDRELQRQMGHADFGTTRHYIKYAEEHRIREYDVFLPKSLKPKAC